ncbi:MAG: alpha/beta fold hydrolase, partial [Actinomycetota bacterium]
RIGTASPGSLEGTRGRRGERIAMTASIREGRVDANGITFHFLEAGTGPLVLLLHGFPDNAWTWKHLIPDIAGAGFRAVAPFMRGYAPTEIPSQPFDTADVTEDIRALVDTLAGEPSYVVGHDWGALATLNVAALYPDVVRRAVSIGAGHPATAVDIFKLPEQLHYAFHIWLFQLEGFGEFALRHDDFALVDYLWQHWSSQPVDRDHVVDVKKTLNEPGVVEAALAYYRGLVRVPTRKPEFFERVTQAISVPTLVVYGADDPAQAISRNEPQHYDGEYRRELVDGSGHFVQLERPDELTRLILEWLRVD